MIGWLGIAIAVVIGVWMICSFINYKAYSQEVDKLIELHRERQQSECSRQRHYLSGEISNQEGRVHTLAVVSWPWLPKNSRNWK